MAYPQRAQLQESSSVWDDVNERVSKDLEGLERAIALRDRLKEKLQQDEAERERKIAGR